ncbi:MAG TPA: ABC transporter ATP-binding protein [Xanthobacteraceae bacterium]|nr:ABC transporter ATP-binding protein [Xanthobacteraceae bacterium]
MAGVTIKGLSKSYGAETAAVGDLDLVIRDNSFVTLLGPSGCGKTTTLRLIAGYMRPDAGTIHIGDTLMSSPDGIVPPEHRGMGMVFQNYAVWPHKTVYENVVFGLKLRKVPHKKAREQVAAALALVNLSGLDDRLPSQLSGGQQQRVALARSLVVEPGILLLDEPLSNLDAKLRERMRTELKELQRRTGITFVYVTHDQAEALALSDQIAVMHSGRLQQIGTPDEVYTRPKNRVVADFMGHVNFLSGKMEPGGLVRLGGGAPISIASPTTIAPGTPVEIAVRPEDVIVQPSVGQPNDAMTARVAMRTFLGNINEYFVTLASGETVRAQTPPKLKFSVGDTVALSFDAANISVFPHTPGKS